MFVLFFLVSLFLLAGQAHAHTPTDLQIQAQARVRQHIEQVLPEAVRTQAQVRVAIHAPRGAALQSCDSGWQWGALDSAQWHRMHVPVACAGVAGSLVAKVEVRGPVYVARTALPKAHRLRPDDVQRHMQRLSSPDAVLPAEQLHDMLLRRAVQAGQMLLPQHLERSLYAKKGERVEIRADAGGIVVSATGIALRNGYQGERIRVRNARSQTWVEGILVEPGVLQAQSTQPGRGIKVQSGD